MDDYESSKSNAVEVEGHALKKNKINNNLQNMRAKQSDKKKYAVSTNWEREQEENSRKRLFCTGTVEDCNTCFCCCSRRVGSMHFLCEKKDGSPIVVAGPCWPFCTFVTFPLIAGLGGLVLWYCILEPNAALPMWVAYIYASFLAITLLSLFCVSCRDPGLMERITDEEAADANFLWNEQVRSYRPPGALYCRECQVLIRDYDHLCPWTGTAIGGRNMRAFKAFVVAVNFLCYGSIGIVVYTLFAGLGKN